MIGSQASSQRVGLNPASVASRLTTGYFLVIRNNSMEWLKGKSTGNHLFSRMFCHILGFSVDVSLQKGSDIIH
jgi:hypothetical protein